MTGISLGINTQGQGSFNSQDSLMRYDIKAMGLYAASSKNWITPLGNLGLHFGSNYNFVETNDGDSDIIVGNRIQKKKYQIHEPSIIYENISGKGFSSRQNLKGKSGFAHSMNQMSGSFTY